MSALDLSSRLFIEGSEKAPSRLRRILYEGIGDKRGP